MGGDRRRDPRSGKNVLPELREEADALYRPAGSGATRNSTGGRLMRANILGYLELRDTPGPPLTNEQLHEAILDHYWPLPEGKLIDPALAETGLPSHPGWTAAEAASSS